jgi:ADP-ribose pyrophosphatase
MSIPSGTREVFLTRWFRLVEKSDETFPAPYYWIESPDCVSVLAVTADGRVPLVRQYRPALDRESLELPAGHIDATDGTGEAAARRELLEETGYEAGNIEFLGVVDPDTGRLRARIWCYFARDAVKVAEPDTGEERIHNQECALTELDQMLRDGRMSHAQDMAVILLARLRGFI